MSAPPARAVASAPTPRPAQNPTQAQPRGRAARTAQRGGDNKGLRTPTALRLAMALAIISALVAGVGGLALGLWQSSSLSSAGARSSQVVSLLAAEADLATADATVTNAFLIGGLEPSELRAAFQTALADGASTIAALAGSPDDSDALLAASASDLVTYSGLIEQARAANRQGFPVGAAYLDQASTLLETTILPDVDTVVVSTAQGAADDLNVVGAASYVGLLLLFPLIVLIGIQVWLSRRTRRTFNPAMAGGTLLLAIAVGVSLWSLADSHSTTTEVRDQSYAGTLALSQSLSLAGQARSDEAFTLIRRGSGAAYEESFQANATAARSFLERQNSTTGAYGEYLLGTFDDWIEAHKEIRALDDAGQWDEAVALATSTADGSPSALYDLFVTQSNSTLDTLVATTQSEFNSLSTRPVIVGWFIAIAGVIAAGLSWRGLSRRLEEYR